jgi:tetratricopeptide (TPR) repeat protein
MAKKPSRTRKKSRPRKTKSPEVIRLLEYEITYEPIEEDYIKRLPEEVKDRIEALHDLAQQEPAEALPELLELVKKHPDVPTFFNYLYVAYTLLGYKDKAKAVLAECCEKHPDYLFTKLSLAGVYLQEGKAEKIPEIFDNKFDLSMLYPDRRVFHISEYVGFASTMGLYYCETGKTDQARIMLDTLEELAPEHPLTMRLRNRLLPEILLRGFDKLMRRKKR